MQRKTLKVDQGCQQKCSWVQSIQKIHVKTIILFWETLFLQIISTKKSCQILEFLWSIINNLRWIFEQISVLMKKFQMVYLSLQHSGGQPVLLELLICRLRLNLKGSNSQFGWPSKKVDPNILSLIISNFNDWFWFN